MAASKSEAPYAYHGLDRIFHEKARLGIVSSLLGRPDGLTFSDLKTLCGLTDGNLSRHLQVLDEAGYIEIEKSFEARRPQTRCRLTGEGRERFTEYLQVLEDVLQKAVSTSESNTGKSSKARLERT